ncbi:hypothetical protein, partial [Nocardia sp. NPDC049707]|uniref:WXG100-like domain-containing protein n=1 Tax=Nocardia sp. NPDC049707 TaxID=3154735 RepID=UPI00343832AF
MAELPGYLQWLEWVAGSDWPAGDPDGMWGLADDWRTAAAGLRDILPDIRDAKTASLKAYPDGDGIEAIVANFDSYLEGPQSLEMLANDFEKLAESATGVGTEIEYAQLMLITSLALLAAEIAIAWIFPPTAPAAEALAIAGTRVAIRMIAKRIMDKIVEIVAKFLGRRLANFLVRHIALDTLLGTVQDWGIQQYQVSSGHRKEVNWEQVGITAISSAVGAGVASPLGERIGKKLADVEMKAWLRGLITGTTAGTVGALAGFGGSVGAQFAFTWAKSGPEGGWDKAVDGLKKTEFDLRMLTAGASNGAMSGANRAMAEQFYQQRHPEWFRPNGSPVDPDSLSRIGFRPDAGTVGAGDGADAGGRAGAASGNGQTGEGAPNAGHTGESAGRSGGDGAADGSTAHAVDGGSAARSDGSSNSSGASDDSARARGADDSTSKAGAAGDGATARGGDDGATARGGDDGATARGGDDGATARAGDDGATARAGDDSSSTARADEDGSASTQLAGDGTADGRAADGGADQSSTRNSEVGTGSEGAVRPAEESATHTDLAAAQTNSTVESNGADDRTADHTGTAAHEGQSRLDAGTRADLTPAGAEHTSNATADTSRASGDNSATQAGAPAASTPLQTGSAPAQPGSATQAAPDARNGGTPSAPRATSTAEVRPGATANAETTRGGQIRPPSTPEPRTTTPSTADTRTNADGRPGTDRFRAGTSDTRSESNPNRTTSENRAGAAQSTPHHPIAEPVVSTRTEPAPTRADAQSDSNVTVRPNSDPTARPDRADAARQAHDSDRAVRPEGDVPETDRAVRSAADAAMRTDDVVRDSGGAVEPRGGGAVRADGDGVARLGDQGVVHRGDEGAMRSGDEGVVRPGDEGVVRPGDEGVVRPGDEGIARPGDEGAMRVADDPPTRSEPSDVRRATDPAGEGNRAGGDIEPSKSHRGDGEEVEARREAARRRAESLDSAVAFVPQPAVAEPHRVAGDAPADRAHDGDGAGSQHRRGGDEVRVPERNRGRCAELSLRLIKAITESSAIRLPERVIGLDGMTAAEVQTAAGGQLRSYGDHGEIARLLLSMPEGSSALVVDEYSGPVDRYNVGAHAYVLVHENGGIVVRDPGAGRVEGFPPTVPRELSGTYAIAFDPAGKPLHPIGSEHPHTSDPSARIGRSLDAQPDQVRELLRQTETGRRIAASFDNGPFRDGFEPSAGDGRAGEFRRRELTAVAFTSGVDHVQQALTLAHESVHAERYVQGRTGDVRAMARDEFVRTMVGEEAAATGRRFQLAREFRDLGHEIAVHPLEETYTTAYDRAAADLSASDSSLTPAEIRQAAHEVAVDALRHEIATYEWRNGRNYTDYYGDAWDRGHVRAQLPPGAHMHDAPADVTENMRSGALARESAFRDLRDTSEELARRATALGLDPTLARQPLQRQITDHLQRIANELAGQSVPPERQAELRTEEHDLRTLADLADQRQHAQATYDQRADQVADAAIREVLDQHLRDAPTARMLNEHIVHIPGEPDRLVIASGTDDHQRVLHEARQHPEIRELLDRPGVVREHLNVDTDQIGRIRVEPIAEPSPNQFDRATDLTPLDRAGVAAQERIARIREQLRETEIGRWADEVLTRNDVDIVHESGADDRYYPSRRTLALDVGASAAAQMAALVHGAIHVELAHTRETPGGAQERMRLPREEYIARMLDEETRAHALEIIAAKQLRVAGHDLAETPLERTYTGAYDAARARAHEENPQAPTSELDRIANAAGLDAIRPEVADHRPEHSSETHAEFYGRAWDDAHGIRSFDDIVRSAIASGERSVTVLSEASSVHAARKVELVAFNDGTELIRKTVMNPRHAVAERLASLLGRTIGANVPEVFHAKSNVVYLEKLAGRVAAERHPQFVDVHELGYADSVAGRALGLLDALIRIPDRDAQGWMIGPQREVIGIDHSRGFEESEAARNALSPFAEHFLRRNGDSIEVIDHHLPRAVVDAITERVAALRPEFDKHNRGEWHDTVLARLAEIRAHASDSPPDHSDTAVRPEDPSSRDADFDDSPNAYTNRYGGDNQHGIHGRVDADGILRVTVRVGDGTPTGREMFRDMMRELGHQVTEIRAEWNADERVRDNLDTFNAGIQELYLTPEDAARNTFTGKLAVELGFTEVRFDQDAMRGRPGEYEKVVAHFSRPETPIRPEAPGDGADSPEFRPEFPPAHPDDAAQQRQAQQQRRDVLDRLAAENAAAVRERDAARAAGDPERIARAEERVARLDEAMAIALQRDALLRAGAIPVTDRVGVVPGEPARVFVVGWGDGDPVRALDAASARHPQLAELRAEPGTVVRELRIGAQGETRVLRIDDSTAGQSRAEVHRSEEAGDGRKPPSEEAGGGKPPPSEEAGGGGKKPPSEPPVPAGTPDDPDHSRNENSGDESADPSNRDEPRRVVIDANGEEVPLQVRPDDAGGWRVETPEESGTPARPADSEPPEKKSQLRRAWERIRQRMRVRGYVGDYPKYPSGSGEDRRGQNAVADGAAHVPDLFGSHPHPQAPQPPQPTPGHETVARPAPEGEDQGLNMARIAKEGWTAWRKREHLPILNRLSGRTRDVAGDFVTPRTPDGEEYRFWVSDADPDLVRQTVTELLEVEAIAPEEARAVLEEALAVADPEQRQRIIDDLENFGLISDEEARALEHEPTQPEQITEIDGLPPEDESLTDTAHRLGLDLPDESPETIRRVLDEQEYRTMREAAAIAGLAEAADRFNEEVTRPYVDADLEGGSGPELHGREPVAGEIKDPDARRGDEDEDYYDEDEPNSASAPRWGVSDATGRPVPLADQVSMFDDNPMGRFLNELITAFDGHPGLRDFRPVGNGADPLREWGDIGDGQELGRDQGPRVFFEHALRRDQLRDAASTWAQMFGLGLDDVNPRNLDATLRRLWAEHDARVARVAEFAEAAEPHLRGAEQEPVGEIHGDQVARVPVGEGAPDRLVVINGPLDRADALARALADDPALADALNRGEVELDYRSARTDRMGQIHLDPVETPEVYHHRETIDGRELVVTMVRDNDGQWRAVQAPVEEATTHSPGDEGNAPPRTRAEMAAEIVALAKELGLGPDALHPDRLARTIAELKLANALRAGQVEALADFARTMNEIENFNDIGDARGQLAHRLDIPESELTPRRVAEALADPQWRSARREQQFKDLADYAKQLRDIDRGAVNAARDRLASQLGLDDSKSLQPTKISIADDGEIVRRLDANGLDPAKLRKVIEGLEGEGKHDQVVDALTEYLRALIDADPYSDVPRGDLSADPRAAGEPPIHELAGVQALREIIAEAMRSGNALDFGRVLADHPGRADGVSGEERGRPEPNRDWARLVGVDIAGADDATFRKVYEAYRDGKIEKHEGLSPAELTAELGRMRAEIQARAEQIRNLAALLDEFYAAPGELTAPGPGADRAPRVGGPDDGGPGRKPGGPADPGSADPPVRPGAEPDARSDWKRRMDAEQDEWNARMHAELDEWIARMHTEEGAADGNSADPLARIDEAFQRESAAAEEAFRRRNEEAEAEHQALMDHLDEVMRRLEERFGDADSSQEAARIDDALARELAAAEEAFQRRDAEAEAEHRALMDRLDEVMHGLDEPLAGVDDLREVVPESDSAASRIDDALARELAAAEEAFQRRDAEAEAEHRALMDRLDEVMHG